MIAHNTEPARRSLAELDRESRLASTRLLDAATRLGDLRARANAEPDRHKRATLSAELREAVRTANAARETLRAIIAEIESRGGRPKGFRDY